MEALKRDQVFELLSARILSGEYPPGHRFPTELQFSRQLGVAKVTLRSALARLEKQGMVQRKVSRGTFVPEDFVPVGKHFAVVHSAPPDISNPYLYVMPGIERRGMEKQVELVRVTCDFAAAPAFFRGSRYDGIIVLGSEFTGAEPVLTAIRQSGLPAVIVGQAVDHATTGMAVIATDNRRAWIRILDYLKCRHFKRIATVWFQSGDVRTRFGEGYENYLRENGLEESVPLIFSAQYNDRSIRATVDRILELPRLPDVIVGYSDFFALVIMEHLKARGLTVPDDIAVMGCCGYPGSAFLETPLSTGDFQYEKKGERAVDLLLEANRWFRPGTQPPLEYIPVKIVERTSTIRKK